MDPRRPLTSAGLHPFAGLADAVLAAPPALGATRLVCVDGPAGSGKTTFAGRLAGAMAGDAAVLHLDDFYAGWTLTGAVARLAAGVLGPLAAGRRGAYHPYDWAAGAFLPEPVFVSPFPVLVVEGCGSGARALAPWTTLLVWVEAPQTLRLARGLARDGAHLAQHWRRWQETEATAFAAEDTRARAGLRVDGTADGDGIRMLASPRGTTGRGRLAGDRTDHHPRADD